MPVAAGRAHTDAVAALLTAAEVLVGRGVIPEGAGWQGQDGGSEFLPYVVLYPAPGRPDADLADPHEYLDYMCQLNCVAATQEGAEAVADAAKAALVGARLTIPGRASYLGQLRLDRPASREDSVAPPLHYAVLQVSWRTQPA